MESRLFTFGCSFTHYPWPTWADIMGVEFQCHQNWGRGGAGNHFIFYSLLEALSRENITQNDTVAIMWTSPAREDRFIRGKWKTTGNIYSGPYPKDYIDKFADPTGYYLTSLFLIDAVRQMLESIGCNWYFFSMVQLDRIHDGRSHGLFGHSRSTGIELSAAELYRSTLSKIYPSMYEVIFANDWNSRNDVIIPHAKKQSLAMFRPRWHECAGPDWPTFDDFINDRLSNVDPDILLEIEQQFNFFTWKNQISTIRQDTHPIPAEHAEYLEKLGFTLSTKQKEFVAYWNEQVLTKTLLTFEHTDFKRF